MYKIRPGLLTSAFSLGFRGVSLGAKFLITIFIGKYFNTEDLGIYGLFITSVTFFSLIIGLDYYNFSNRKLINSKPEEKAGVIKEQFFIYFFSYLFFIPLLFYVGNYFLPTSHLPYFIALVVLEHFAQELFRITIALEKSTKANFFLFLRSGIWPLIIMALFYSKVISYNLEYIWIAWVIFSFVTIIANLTYLFSLLDTTNLHQPVQVKLLKAGLTSTILFFLTTVCYKIIEVSDRYVIDIYRSKEEVGVYTFYSQIVNLSNVIITTSVIFISFPQLIKASQNNDWKQFRETHNSISKKVIYISIFICFLLFLLSKPGFKYVNQEFVDHISSFYLLNLSSLALNISLISHFSLYALQLEKHLFYTSAICAITNIVLNLLLVDSYGLMGASIATFVSYTLVLFLKYKIDRNKINTLTSATYA